MSTIKLLAVSGSLREGSYNTALLRAAAQQVPHGVEMELASIGDIPLYNADLDEPESVLRLKGQIEAANGVLISTPEYNYGVPGPLKNAIDWASRPGYQSVFLRKPVGIVGASGSSVGTARAQGQLKQVLLGMLSLVFPYPEFLVARAFQKFDDDGTLTDEKTRDLLAEYLEVFVEFVRS